MKSLADFWREKRKNHIGNEILAYYTQQHYREFHILDSLRSDTLCRKEVKQLQLILLQYFKDELYAEGHIVVNIAKVIHINIFKICLFIHCSGASTKEYQRLWLLHNLFREEVFEQPRGDYGSC